MQAKETVHIPFRYQTFEADHRVAVQGPSHFHATPTSIQPIRNACVSPDQSKVAKVGDRSRPTRLRVKLFCFDAGDHPHIRRGAPSPSCSSTSTPSPPRWTRPCASTTLSSPSSRSAFACLRLTLHVAIVSSVIVSRDLLLCVTCVVSSQMTSSHAVCTDTEVVCQAKLSSPDSPREIYLKAPCGESPSIRKFYLCIYTWVEVVVRPPTVCGVVEEKKWSAFNHPSGVKLDENNGIPMVIALLFN